MRLEELQEIAATDVLPENKLGLLLDKIVGNFRGSSHWGARVLGRELTSPSSHIAVLRDEEVPPKIGIILGILSEITGIPTGEPALLCCMVSVAAPCAMLLMAGDNLPHPQRDLLRMSPEQLSAHLQCFALGGLRAVASAYRSNREVVDFRPSV